MEQITNILNKAVKKLYKLDVIVILSWPDYSFGDFSTNIAMQLAKQLNKNPKSIADEIAEEIKSAPELKSVSVAGPGFINLRATDEVLLNNIELSHTKYNSEVAHQTVVIETNNPNPFKAMHIGHAFNAIIADTIANLLQASGAEVHRVSYHGNVGAHVGKSMYSILRYINGDVKKLDAIAEADRNSFMSKMYASGNKAFKDDPNANAQITKLAEQSFLLDDPLYKQVYDICSKWSFDQIDSLVKRLGNKPVEKRYLESQADALGVELVMQNIGEVFIESDGAIIFPGEKYDSFNNIFVSSSGRGLYGARDIGLIQLKQNDFNPNKSYIVTAEEQRDYFKGVIKASELCFPKLKGVTHNISTGTVKLTSGKMSSRSGDVLEVSWLFVQISSALKKSQKDSIEAIVTATIRYQFLKVKVGGDIIFDINEATSLQGNTGPYLLYSFVRASSILRNVKTKGQIGGEFDESERRLLLKISQFNEVLNMAISELSPHLIASYLYELTQEFNRFYEKNRVIGDNRQNQRLYLLDMYKQTLKKGLDILGIPTVESM